MQTSLPASQPVVHVEWWQELVPLWAQFVIGFILIGAASSFATIWLRSAFPPAESPVAKKLNYLYPGLLGTSFATAAPFALPGFGYSSRWLWGLVSSVVWYLIYDAVKKPAEAKLGVTLPSSGDIVSAAGGAQPTTPPSTGGKS